MADKKKRGTGFDAPVYGKVVPEGTKYEKLPNGKYRVIAPKNKKK